MQLLRDSDKEKISHKFEELKGHVKIVLFIQQSECQYCEQTQYLVEQMASLSDMITAEIYDIVQDKEKAEEYGVDKVPAIALIGEKDYGIRYYGVPTGYEFPVLLEDIVSVSAGDSGLTEETKELLSKIEKPVHIQVFTTPTCPYCPKMVSLVHRLAIESDQIRADMVESMEFRRLTAKYAVRGVPKAVVNESIYFEGNIPEKDFVKNLLDRLKK